MGGIRGLWILYVQYLVAAVARLSITNEVYLSTRFEGPDFGAQTCSCSNERLFCSLQCDNQDKRARIVYATTLRG
jgi:hypothetical protein